MFLTGGAYVCVMVEFLSACYSSFLSGCLPLNLSFSCPCQARDCMLGRVEVLYRQRDNERGPENMPRDPLISVGMVLNGLPQRDQKHG